MGLTEFYSTPRRRLEVGHHFTTTFWIFTSLPLMKCNTYILALSFFYSFSAFSSSMWLVR